MEEEEESVVAVEGGRAVGGSGGGGIMLVLGGRGIEANPVAVAATLGSFSREEWARLIVGGAVVWRVG